MADFPSVIPRPPEDSGPAGFVQAMNALADAVENLDERPSGGVTDHGDLDGLADDDHTQYALADGSRGSFAATSHTHTAAEISNSTVTGRAVLTAADAATARSAIGAGTSSFSGAYADLSGKPTLGTAAAEDVGDFAAASHSHPVGDLTATGTRDATTVLHGDNTWKVPAGGGGGGDLTGTGMPDGVISAPPGTYYTDTAGTNGAWRWLKTGGTGSTGWVVSHGDTGWRNVLSLIDGTRWNTTASGTNYARIRRIGDVVHVSIRVARTLATGNRATGAEGIILTLPTGWRGQGLGPTANAIIQIGTAVHLAFSGSANNLTVAPNAATGTWGTGDLAIMFGSFPTNDAWPTTLPGSPA